MRFLSRSTQGAAIAGIALSTPTGVAARASGQSTRDWLSVMIAFMQDGSVSATPAGLPSSPGTGQRLREAMRRDWPVWLLALGVFANGSLDIMVVLTVRAPRAAERFGMLLPFGLLEGWNRTATVVLGVTMIYLSFHLLRRRRVAWWLASAAVGLVTVFHLLDWHRAYLALASGILFGFLLATRSRFTGRFQMREVLPGLRLMLITLAVALVWGALGFWLLDLRYFGRELGFGEALVRALRQFALLGNSDLVPRGWGARWFLRFISVLGVTAEALAFYSLFRPVAYRLAELPQERARASQILVQYGRSSYDYFKVWPDKSFFFGSQRSFVAYKVHRGVAVSLGDPVGPEEDLETTVSSFVRYCRENGWQAAFLLPDQTVTYRRLGLWVIKVGEEARVDLEHFRTKTSHKKYFRYVRRKFEGEGYAFARHLPPHPASLLDEIEGLSAEWLRQPQYREFGFVQGQLERSYLEKTRLATLHEPQGRMIAFVNEVPSYLPGEANFDMMRRLPDTHWGTMDYLFTRLMLMLYEEGYRWFNMGLAPFAGVGDSEEATRLEKTVGRLAEHIDWLVHTQGMLQYKLKFEPVWQDRHLVYDGGPLALPQVVLAVTTVV